MRSQLCSLSLSWGRRLSDEKKKKKKKRRRDEPEEKKAKEATSMERKEEAVGGGQGKQERRFPKGFRFHPTDQELVKHYLIPMVEKRTLPFHIPTLDVYGTEPSRLPKDLTHSVRGEFFCFARRTRCSENGTRAKRTVTSAAPGEAMSGTWHANSNPDDIMVDGKAVAKRRLLSYRNGVSEKNSSWVMHEYCLEDSSKFQDVVLCKIRNRKADRDERAPPSSSPSPLKRMRAAEGTCVDAEESLEGPETPPAFEDGECQALMAAAPPAGTDQLTTNQADPKLPDGFTDALQHPLAIEPQNCELLLDDAAVPSATTAQVQCTRHGVDPSTGMHLLRQLPSEAYSGTPPDYYYMTPELEDVTLSYPSVACHGPPALPWLPETMIESNPTGIMRTRLATSFARGMTETSVRQIICYARSECQCAPELQAPPGPVQGHWPGSPPSPSPLTAPAMPASGQRPGQPSPLAFFEGSSPAQVAPIPTAGFNTRPPAIICMPLNAVPTAPRPEQAEMTRDGGWGWTTSPAPPAFPLSRAFIHGRDGSEGFLQQVLASHNSARKKPAHEGAELMQYPDDSDRWKVVQDLTAGDQEASPSTLLGRILGLRSKKGGYAMKEYPLGDVSMFKPS